MHVDNLIFLVLVALAGLFKLLASKRDSSTGESDSPPPSTSIPRTRPPAETDEERIRRFLEALGQPTSSRPPSPVAPRADIPPRPVAPVQPPQSMRPFSIPQRRLTPEEKRKRYVILPKGASGSSPTSPVPEQRPIAAKMEEPATFEVRDTGKMLEPASATTAGDVTTAETAAEADKIDIVALLRSPSGLRSAIILREIFGPPRSMQPLDFAGIS